ncbi:unnamed protein product [Arctogadus glacialis]
MKRNHAIFNLFVGVHEMHHQAGYVESVRWKSMPWPDVPWPDVPWPDVPPDGFRPSTVIREPIQALRMLPKQWAGSLETPSNIPTIPVLHHSSKKRSREERDLGRRKKRWKGRELVA